MALLASRRAVLLSAFTPLLRPQSQQDARFAVDVSVVNVLATVRDKHGNIASNLTKEDFTLEEDGRPQAIRYFARQSDLPLTLGLLIDTSGSQRRVLAAQRRASDRFLQQVLREDKDLAFLIQFDIDVELLQDLTSSKRLLQKALDAVDAPEMLRRRFTSDWQPPQRRRRGGTSLYDAVLLASDEEMRKQAGRKALILLSDGVDNGSKVPLTDAIEAAQRADTLVYAIRFFDRNAYGARTPRRNPDGETILKRLAKETGGGYYDVTGKMPIEKIYQRIEAELRNQYSIGYTSDQPPSPGFRKIRLVTKQSLVAQTREGYYPRQP